MFGGLEIKSKSSKEDDSATSAPSAGSAFDFLNSGTSSAPSEPAPATSGFSFLNGAAEPAPAQAPSSFSFLQDAPAPAPEPAKEDATSGFSFLIPSPEKEASGKEQAQPQSEPEIVEELASSQPEGASSAFSFLSGGPAATPELESVVQPGAAPTPVVSSTSSVPSTPAPPLNVLEAPAPVPSGPTGAGITFGTASAPRTVRKKKSRAQKVGMGASVSTIPTPAAAPAPPVAQNLESPKPEPKPPSPKSARDGAADAARRAEEFMQQKAKEQAKAAENPSQSISIPAYDEIPAVMPSPSTDEVVAAAKAAAEEAKTMSQQPKGFMGTFFKGFGGSSSSLGSNSNKGRRPSPTPATNGATTNSTEVKRAATLPELPAKDEDDDVVVSTSVGRYQPEPPVTTPAVIETPATNIVQPTFQPAKPKAPTYVVREMAPTPKKKKTAKDTFEEYEALFAQSVHRAMEQVENVRGQQKMLMEDRFVSLAKQSLAAQQIEQTESQLQTAVEEEDYELADQLGEVIEGHKREQKEVAMFLDSITAGLAQLDSQKSLVVKGVATCFENLTVRLTELQEKESATEHSNDSETLKQFASISKQLSAEQERLSREYKAIELDEERAAEERTELESAISEQSGEFQKQQDDVKKQLSEIEVEIEALRKQLEEKQNAAAGLRKEMYGLDDSISKVRVKFTRQLNRVDKKERSVRENRIEWETEQSTFEKQKEAHELQVKTHSESLLAHDELVKTLEDELKLAKEFADFVPTKLGILEDIVAGEEKDSEAEGDLAQLQADVVKCEAAVSEAKVLLKAANATIQNLETEHANLIARIPQLEDTKKAAASKRDFKAAGKASKDIKDATARLKECEEELVGEAATRKKSAEDELKQLDAALVDARKVATEKEKISAQIKMAALADRIQILTDTKEELCGNCSSSENNVRGVGALVLDIQIKALQDEGEGLGSKYGGWDKLVQSSETKNAADMTTAEDESREAVTESTVSGAGVVDSERISKARELIKGIQVAEESVETAAANENFEEAAELQEQSEKLQAELEKLGLSDAEMELALADEEPETAEHEEHSPPAEVSGEQAADSNESLSTTSAVEPSGGEAENEEGCAMDQIAEDVQKDADDGNERNDQDGENAQEAAEENIHADENKENAEVGTEGDESAPDISDSQNNNSASKAPDSDVEKVSVEGAVPEVSSTDELPLE